MDKFIRRLNFKPGMFHNIYGLIARIDELKGSWKGQTRLSPQMQIRLKKSVIITSSGASTRIEGANLSDEQVENLLKGLKIQKLKTRDEQEVAGYAELLSNIFESYKTIKLSENTIRHIHNELLKYSEKDTRHRGNYKFTPNRVEAKDPEGKVIQVLFNPAPPHLAQKYLLDLVEWTNKQLAEKKVHPLLIIAHFIFEFLSIHPFQDGNGRASRILTNFLLLQEGYEYIPYVSHEKLIEDNKDKYYIALYKSQKNWNSDHEDISPWIEFFLTVFLEQTKKAMSLLSEESIESLLSAKQLLVWNYLLEHGSATPKELRNVLKIGAPTILQILNKLLKLKKIVRLGEGSATKYKLL